MLSEAQNIYNCSYTHYLNVIVGLTRLIICVNQDVKITHRCANLLAYLVNIFIFYEYRSLQSRRSKSIDVRWVFRVSNIV